MSKGRVLLIGGDPDITRTLQVYLEAHQFSVQAVDTGDAAIEACCQSPPDVVILDWNLPDMAGNLLCRQIRAHEGTLGTILLVLTSADERDAKLAALEAGADDIKTLPIDIEEIRLKIEEMLRR
jgi:DNA-binding response OmpR family regulator